MQTLTGQIDENQLKLIYSDEKPYSWSGYKHYVSLKCPCCKKQWDEGYDVEGYDSYDWNYRQKTKGSAEWDIYKQIVLHIVCQVRLNGDVKHIKLLLKLFGKKKGKKLLKKYAKKSIIVARNIKRVLNKLK